MSAKGLWKTLFWLNWAFIVWFWWSSAGGVLTSSVAEALVGLGRLMGLSAAYLVLMQFVTTGRILWIERSFGMDKLTKVHQRNGKYALIFILVHPLLIIYGRSLLSSNSFLGQFTIFLKNDDLFKAFLGFLLFIAVVIISLTIIRSKLKYETWYYVHLLMYAAVFFSYEHQFEQGETVNGSKLFYGYWVALYLLVLISFGFFRFVRPLLAFYYHRFKVVKVVQETPTVASVYISGSHMEQFQVEPGQFMLFRFLTKGMWGQSHPFSMSIFPDGKHVRISVRAVGDFTHRIPTLAEGTPVIIEGPYGRFTKRAATEDKVLLIAGGIGITPIRSLFEQFLTLNKDVVLIYGNRDLTDVPLKSELEALSQQYKKTLIHVLSAAPDFTGEKGYVDGERLKRLVPDLNEREVFVCGPVPMMELVIAAAKSLGVRAEQIHFERFAF